MEKTKWIVVGVLAAVVLVLIGVAIGSGLTNQPVAHEVAVGTTETEMVEILPSPTPTEGIKEEESPLPPPPKAPEVEEEPTPGVEAPLTLVGQQARKISVTLGWGILVMDPKAERGGLCMNQTPLCDVFWNFEGPTPMKGANLHLVEVYWGVSGESSGGGFVIVEAEVPIEWQMGEGSQREVAKIFGFNYPEDDTKGNPILKPDVLYTLPISWWPLSAEEALLLEKQGIKRFEAEG